MTTTARTLTEAERRAQLLKAAREAFDEKGYESATVSDIVRRAGVAQGTFYLYFGTKKDIVVELSQRPMELVADRLRSMAAVSPSFEETMRGMVRTGFAIAREYPDLCRLIHMGSGAMEQAKATSTGQDLRAIGVNLFKDAIASGDMEPVDADVAFDTFHSMLSGAMQHAFADQAGERVDVIEQAVTELVVRAFVKRI